MIPVGDSNTGCMYLDQLLGAAGTQKLVELLFWPFSTFVVNSKPFSVTSHLKSLKKSENEEKISVSFYFCLLLKAG